MKKCITVLLLILTELLLPGCALRTVEEMYALPRRSEEFSQLQSAIDAAMKDLTYSAPISGENQQTLQSADLDGDGVEEYLVFATGNSEKPLQVLIFDEDQDGTCRLSEVIQSNGSAFEQVEYVNFDERPGCELVIGRQVSDQVLRSVSVYSFSGGSAEQLFMIGYSKFLTCDLDENGRSEVMVLRPGETEAERGMAVLYSSWGGQIQRSVERELSQAPSQIRRISQGALHGGTPAVYVTSSVDENTIVTDIFAMSDGKFTNVSYSGESDTSIQTLLNSYVYPEDIDGDGILELPSLLSMKPVSEREKQEEAFLLRWFSMDTEGREADKRFTFHYIPGGWYILLDSQWASRISVEDKDGRYTFFVWDETYQEATPLFMVYIFTDSDRDEEAVRDGRFALYRTEGVACAAELTKHAGNFGLTEQYLIECFRLIRQDWRTGERFEG